ncbi:DUF2431 domain-containing protein [Durusdinium trenchii]|uniref:DUF2431 domain-containing protein n=1 Tax=Durusdinium trenchii TaxID=1381693 RepID=A0ABP0RM47_9DINO
MMHYYIQNYLESAAKVCKENGQLVVVVTSAQYLNWNLYKCKPTVNDEDVTPQVRWFDARQTVRWFDGSRFGDGRDRYVEQPVFHRLCDTVAVIWRMDHGSLDPGVTEEEILARKKLLEEVGTDRPEKEIPHPDFTAMSKTRTGNVTHALLPKR